ncbi:MAG: hypothetical protein IJ079_06645 [Lachnospiraceae bacterium]|nr:hypothetical protein [Lachnospiraceae bacterium]
MVSNVSSTSYSSATAAAATSTASTKAAEVASSASAAETPAAVYEKSSSASTQTGTVAKKDNSAVVAQLKADQDARLNSLKSLVEKLITKQGQSFAWANKDNEDIMNDSSFWNAIRTGNFEVDDETVAQAQKDIAEDGYWGVKQTSDRLLDFAKALTGGDASKVEQMRDAIKKGFDEAKKLWGGELPEISQQTYDATMEKLDAWAKEATE